MTTNSVHAHARPPFISLPALPGQTLLYQHVDMFFFSHLEVAHCPVFFCHSASCFKPQRETSRPHEYFMKSDVVFKCEMYGHFFSLIIHKYTDTQTCMFKRVYFCCTHHALKHEACQKHKGKWMLLYCTFHLEIASWFLNTATQKSFHIALAYRVFLHWRSFSSLAKQSNQNLAFKGSLSTHTNTGSTPLLTMCH